MSNYSDSSFSEEMANTSWYKVLHQTPKGSKVLDVGCSSGNFGAELKKRLQCQVDGIELDTDDALRAKQRLDRVYQLNIETDSLNEIDRDYDVIYFGDVIEHLVNPIQALERVKEHLAPGGCVLFSIPNMGHVTVRLLLLDGDFDYTETGLLDKTHLHFYNQKEVERIFVEAGFKIKVLDYVEKDYPRAVLVDHLTKLGLTANETFFKKMAKVDASAFQFVGQAVPAKKQKRPLQQFGPVDLFEKFFTDTVSNYEKDIKDLKVRLQAAEIASEKFKELKANPLKFVAKRVVRRIKK